MNPTISETSSSAETYDAKTYVIQAVSLQGIIIPSYQMKGVINTFVQIQAIAQPVLDFQLPESLEPLPRFEP